MENEKLGERLEIAIRAADLTISEAAKQFEAAGVKGGSRPNLYKILRDENGPSPSVEFLEGVCRVLGVSADWMLFGRGEMSLSDPVSDDKAEAYGVQGLPGAIQGDVEQLALVLVSRMRTTGLNQEDTVERIGALCRGIAAWIRLPLRSDKFRRLDAVVERTAYCDAALRALRMLIPDEDDERPPEDIDEVLERVADLERDLAGRSKPPDLEMEPESPARIRSVSEGN